MDKCGVRTSRGSYRYLTELRGLCRQNRNNPTRAEFVMWHLIIKKKILGYKFLRQKPIDRFILDFYCPKLLLAIEIDGSSHMDKENYDQGRDEALMLIGIKTIRFSNDLVINQTSHVYRELVNEIEKRKLEL